MRTVATIAVLSAAFVAVAHGANLKATDFPTAASTAAGGTLVKNYELSTPGGIQGFNPFLTASEAVNAASFTGNDCKTKPFYATCADTPALASGFTVAADAADGSTTFYAISDRGPNQVKQHYILNLEYSQFVKNNCSNNFPQKIASSCADEHHVASCFFLPPLAGLR